MNNNKKVPSVVLYTERGEYKEGQSQWNQDNTAYVFVNNEYPYNEGENNKIKEYINRYKTSDTLRIALDTHGVRSLGGIGFTYNKFKPKILKAFLDMLLNMIKNNQNIKNIVFEERICYSAENCDWIFGKKISDIIIESLKKNNLTQKNIFLCKQQPDNKFTEEIINSYEKAKHLDFDLFYQLQDGKFQKLEKKPDIIPDNGFNNSIIVDEETREKYIKKQESQKITFVNQFIGADSLEGKKKYCIEKPKKRKKNKTNYNDNKKNKEDKKRKSRISSFLNKLAFWSPCGFYKNSYKTKKQPVQEQKILKNKPDTSGQFLTLKENIIMPLINRQQ